MTLHHSQANLTGTVEATSHHPDGRELVRIADHWLFRDECEEVVTLMDWDVTYAEYCDDKNRGPTISGPMAVLRPPGGDGEQRVVPE